MKTLVMYQIAVTHPASRETVKFLGQGETVAAAVKDGIDNLTTAYRPDSSGHAKPSIGIGVPPTAAVTLPNGRQVNRRLANFESGAPWAEGEK